MGDIRLTMGQQEEIIAEVKRLTFALERIRDTTMSHVASYDHGFQRCREIARDALANTKMCQTHSADQAPQ